MLFEGCRSVHTYAMRAPIAVVFLDRSGRVVQVVRASPGRFLLCRKARHVLECHIGADVRLGDVLSRRAGLAGRATRGDRDSARPARS